MNCLMTHDIPNDKDIVDELCPSSLWMYHIFLVCCCDPIVHYYLDDLSHKYYPLVICYIAIEHGPVEIVDDYPLIAR